MTSTTASASSSSGSPNSSVAGHAPGLDPVSSDPAPLRDADVVEVLAQQRPLERLVADRRDLLERA